MVGGELPSPTHATIPAMGCDRHAPCCSVVDIGFVGDRGSHTFDGEEWLDLSELAIAHSIDICALRRVG
jgi:hypothetical protein